MVAAKEPRADVRNRQVLALGISLIWSIITIVVSIGLFLYAGLAAAPFFSEQPTADDLRTAALWTFLAGTAWGGGFSILGAAHRSRRWFVVAIVGSVFFGVAVVVYLARSTTSGRVVSTLLTG